MKSAKWKLILTLIMGLPTQHKNMDSSTKDTVANLATVSGLGMTMADITSVMTLCVLCTAFILNIQRIYHFFKDRQK